MFISDKAIGEIFKTCEESGYVLMVTADHGNAEQMFSEHGGPHTAHTTNRGTVVNKYDNFQIFSAMFCEGVVVLW